MKTRAIFWSFKLLAASWALSVSPAEADIGPMVFGESFKVGSVEFRIGYGQRSLQGPSYYFATHSSLIETEHPHSEYCFSDGEQHYHHKSCPVARRLLNEHGFSTDYLVGSFGPNLGVGYSKPLGHRSSYRGYSNSYGVPPEQVARVGSCRIWYPDRPSGHQPPPVDCSTARRVSSPDAYVIYDGPIFSGH